MTQPSDLANITVNNKTTYTSLSYSIGNNEWSKIPFGVPVTLRGTNPPVLILLGTNQAPLQVNIADTDPPQPSFTSGQWTMESGGFSTPGVVFTNGHVRIKYYQTF